jgi:hypothetical protein
MRSYSSGGRNDNIDTEARCSSEGEEAVTFYRTKGNEGNVTMDYCVTDRKSVIGPLIS